MMTTDKLRETLELLHQIDINLQLLPTIEYNAAQKRLEPLEGLIESFLAEREKRIVKRYFEVIK